MKIKENAGLNLEHGSIPPLFPPLKRFRPAAKVKNSIHHCPRKRYAV